MQFMPADIVSQVINFGVSSPIDLQVEGPDLTKTFPFVRQLRDAVRQVPGAVDVTIRQILDYPTLKLMSTASAPLGWASPKAMSLTACWSPFPPAPP